jgi:enoyl-CoA hydratase
MDEAMAAAAAICQLGLPSVMAAKACVNQAFEGPLSAGMTHERQVFHSLFATEDQKEGMDAFLSKRPAVFVHR